MLIKLINWDIGIKVMYFFSYQDSSVLLDDPEQPGSPLPLLKGWISPPLHDNMAEE